jgi:ElaB/YqjD/DUF883 family membrane-anchored ribosome-binding protein
MPVTPEKTMDDVEDVIDDVKNMASEHLAAAQDEISSFTQRKPIAALLTALVVGVVLGKLVL